MNKNTKSCRNDGNPFNSVSVPSSPPPPPPSSSSSSSSSSPSPSSSTTTTTTPSPALPFFWPPATSGNIPPSPERKPAKQADLPFATREPNSKSSKVPSTKRIVWISVTVVWSFIILVLAVLLCLPKCRGSKPQELAPYMRPRDIPTDNGSLVQPGHDIEKAPLVLKAKKDHQPMLPASIQMLQNHEQNLKTQNLSAIQKEDSHEISLSRFDIDFVSPPPPPPPPTQERAIIKPITAVEESQETIMKHLKSSFPPASVKSFTVASLQQYTNSFSQDNLVGNGTLGTVYKGELPDGTVSFPVPLNFLVTP